MIVFLYNLKQYKFNVLSGIVIHNIPIIPTIPKNKPTIRFSSMLKKIFSTPLNPDITEVKEHPIKTIIIQVNNENKNKTFRLYFLKLRNVNALK